MTKKRTSSPSEIDYMKRRLAAVEQERAQSPNVDVAQVLADLESPDEGVRLQAVKQVCPCRLPWDTFHQLRKAAQRLQKDPNPQVRAHARHIEEDAREIESLEALRERLESQAIDR